MTATGATAVTAQAQRLSRQEIDKTRLIEGYFQLIHLPTDRAEGEQYDKVGVYSDNDFNRGLFW